MRARLASATLLLLSFATPPAFAASSSGLEGATAISDARLGEIRGKFISPGNISFFGVQMQTSWQGSDGITTSATLLFSVDFANGAGNADGATPTLLVGYDRTGDPTMDVPGFGAAAADGYVAVAISAGGLGSVQGAVQSQQIAGDDNRVGNSMRIAIVPAAMVQAARSDGLTPINGSQTTQFSDGDSLQFSLGANQVGLVLTNGGSHDAVNQTFDGMIGQAAQNVLIASNNNVINNDMEILIGFNALEQAARISVQNAMSSMKGVGP